MLVAIIVKLDSGFGDITEIRDSQIRMFYDLAFAQ